MDPFNHGPYYFLPLGAPPWQRQDMPVKAGDRIIEIGAAKLSGAREGAAAGHRSVYFEMNAFTVYI